MAVGEKFENYVGLLVHDSSKYMSIIRRHQVWYKICLQEECSYKLVEVNLVLQNYQNILEDQMGELYGEDIEET